MRAIKPEKLYFLVFTALILLPPITEIFTYHGFIKKHLFIDAGYIVTFGLFLLIIVYKKYIGVFDKGYYFYAGSFITLAIFLISAVLEEYNYPNYVFTKFHINYKNAPLLVAALFTGGFVNSAVKYLSKIVKKNPSIFLIISFLSAVFIFKQAKYISVSVMRIFPLIIAKPGLSYSEKLYYFWDNPVKYLDYVSILTNENASIYLPTSTSAQEITGNIGLVRYFLYPRKLNLYDPEKSVDGYVIASPGNELGDGNFNNWPDFDIECEFFYLIDLKNQSVNFVKSEFSSGLISGDTWALIKI